MMLVQKNYMDTKNAKVFQLNGTQIIMGTLNMDMHYNSNMVDPSNSQDTTTKNDVDIKVLLFILQYVCRTSVGMDTELCSWQTLQTLRHRHNGICEQSCRFRWSCSTMVIRL